MNAVELQYLCGGLLGLCLLYTVLGYPRKYGALSGRSRLFRTVGMVLANILLITVFVYVSTDWQAQRLQIGMLPSRAEQLVKISQLLYFSTWLLIGVLLVGIAALDLLENFSIYRRTRREAMNDMFAGAVAAQRQKQTVSGPTNGSDDGGSVA